MRGMGEGAGKGSGENRGSGMDERREMRLRLRTRSAQRSTLPRSALSQLTHNLNLASKGRIKTECTWNNNLTVHNVWQWSNGL